MSLLLLLGTEMREQVERGFEVIGISAPGPYVPEIERLGVRHVSVPELTRSWGVRDDVRAARRLYRILTSLQLDVLHTHTPKAGVLGRILGRFAGVPVVVNTCHGLWSPPGQRPFSRAAVWLIEALAAQFSDLEFFQNAEDRRTLQRVIPERKGLVVGNGIDLERFRFDEQGRTRIRRELGVDDSEVLVGGVGRRVREKGIAELNEVAGALGSRAHFVWVGPADPEKGDAVEQDTAALRFLGERRDMADLYSALDVFVLPSHREGFSRSAMEAAACRCALVLSDIRGCREIGVPGVHALFVVPRRPDLLERAIGRLLDDPPLRARLSDAAERRARELFDQRRVARLSREGYRSVARRKALAQVRAETSNGL
jgi:glycosyltransferase involved in cell wall biosynthesis